MLDNVVIAKQLYGKDRPFLVESKVLEWVKTDKWGETLYLLKGFNGNALKVYWSELKSELRLEGSLMYYWKGHNFSCSPLDLMEAIDHIGEILKVNLWSAEVLQFEWGIFIELELPPAEYIRNHTAGDTRLEKNPLERYKGRAVYWEDRTEGTSIKLYDAKRNFANKLGASARRELLKEGWNQESEYLKLEIQYHHPERLNNGAYFLLKDIVNPTMVERFKKDLLNQYKRLTPMKQVNRPKGKENNTSANIILQSYIKLALNVGKTTEWVKNVLDQEIKSNPELDKEARKGRKKQIKIEFERIKEGKTSEWDLTSQILEALDLE